MLYRLSYTHRELGGAYSLLRGSQRTSLLSGPNRVWSESLVSGPKSSRRTRAMNSDAPRPPAPSQLASAHAFAPPGTRLVEHWGMGGAFEVALVRDEHERLLVAKRQAPHARREGGDDELFREHELLRSLRGNLAPAWEGFGSDERGPFLLQARAPGCSVRALWEGQAPLSAARWRDLARATSRALALLHQATDQKGPLLVVHGDISPDNLFFSTSTAHVTFLDFSSSTWRDAPRPVSPSGRGTLPYCAPELARQETIATQASDTYALAATLLAAALGGVITEANTEASRLLEIGTRGAQVEKLAARLDLSVKARAAITEALRFDLEQRLTSSREFAERLE